MCPLRSFITWQISGGKRHGVGTVVYANNRGVYEGQFANDMQHGEGIFKVGGEEVKGTWTNDIFDGGDFEAVRSYCGREGLSNIQGTSDAFIGEAFIVTLALTLTLCK